MTRLRLCKMRSISIAVAVAMFLVAAGPALCQAQNASSSTGGDYSLYDISPFFGWQWFQLYQGKQVVISRFDSSPILGARFSADFSRYIGGEASFTYGFNDLRLTPPAGPKNAYGSEMSNLQLAINPVFHFRPREAKWRPFLTAGPGFTYFETHENVLTTSTGQYQLRDRYGPAFIYGGGLKLNPWQRVGLRFDLRGMYTKKQFVGLPSKPVGPDSIYISHGHNYSALQATVGLVFRFGMRSNRVEAPPPPPPPPPKPPEIRISAIEGARDVCPGEDVKLSATASGWNANQTPQYQWLINGQPVAGANAATFSLPTQGRAGVQAVALRVSAGGVTRTSDPVNVRVKEYRAPTVQFSLPSGSIAYGDKLSLAANTTGSECSGTISTRYSASQGTISGDSFDSSGVRFDMNNRSKLQTAVVTLTATATDQRGGTGSASTDVRVTLSPEARRFDDMIFPASSSRVNNCAKRLLLEQLAPMMREDPNATVILIGHRDANERSRQLADIDQKRALNAAAVLSAGTGVCAQIELSRIKVNWVGTDQSAPTRPSLCGTSTGVQERGGQAISDSDKNAQFRRVEVYFVPSGAAMPAGMSALKDAPEKEVKSLGCPR